MLFLLPKPNCVGNHYQLFTDPSAVCEVRPSLLARGSTRRTSSIHCSLSSWREAGSGGLLVWPGGVLGRFITLLTSKQTSSNSDLILAL